MTTIARLGRVATLALAIGLAAPTPGFAQEMGGESSANPIAGYVVAGALCIAIAFAISMSARR